MRGGGAATDLAAFDDESVARAIALAPVPVLVGIGHETDATVADRVAARSLPTPTACASALVDRVAAFARSLDHVSGRVAAAAENGLRRQRGRLEQAARSFAGAAMASVRVERRLSDDRAVRVVHHSRSALERARRRVEIADVLVSARDPGRLLAQGWSITRDESGAPVTSVRDLGSGAELSTRVRDGTIASVVTGTEEDDDRI